MPNRLSGWIRPNLAPREHQATRLVAMSFDAPASPTVTLKAVARSRRGQPYGWGFAWYPEQSASALVVKDATSSGDNAMTKLLREWDRFHSTLFLCHLRGAARALAEQDTHPFCKSHGGREWVLAHNGDLEPPEGEDLSSALPLGEDPVFEPVGRTDSERAFCWLLAKARAAGAKSLAEVGWPRLHDWFRSLDALGTANFMVTDGRDLAVYRDEEGYNQLHRARLVPPNVPAVLETDDLEVDFDDIRDRTRTAIVFSTEPLSEGFKPMLDGQLVVVRRGAYIYDSEASEATQSLMVPPLASSRPTPRTTGPQSQAALQHAATSTVAEAVEPAMPPADAEPTPPAPEAQIEVGLGSPPEPEAAPESEGPGPAPAPRRVVVPPLHHHAEQEGEGRLLSVRHETIYRYDRPVERSFHLFRLKPVHDRWQDLLQHELTLSVDGILRDFEDVFGNLAARVEVNQPYTELKLSAHSLVRVRGNVPDDLHSPHRRFTIPLVWMPWQRQMMLPYLLPPELPETQLTELTEFAMSFVQRQDYDLVQTLVDMNTTLYRDFSYVSGSTTMATTPFNVFISRKGVCQDFANLLICLARLLGVPARYRVGYIYTGGNYENKAQSDASHAWAELYLPWTGWQGFDPTNGVMVGTDHVRTACGRNYGDATPTSGTIYKGGGRETLKVDVKVEEAEAL